MKNLFAVVVAAVAVLAAHPAWADGNAEPMNEECRLPAGTDMACVARCFPQNAGSADAAPACGSCTPDPDVNRRIKRLSADYRRLSRDLAEQSRRVEELTGQVGILGRRTSDLEGQLAAAKRKLDELAGGLKALQGEITQIVGDLVDLQREVGELRDQVKSLETRVEALERRLGPVKIGPRAGFLGLRTTDGTSYTGGTFGVRLTLNLDEAWSVHVDASALAAHDPSPMGTAIRGGVSYDLFKWLALEGGVGTAFVGYDDRLKARSNFTTGDLGVTLRPFWKFEVGANLLLGAEFDQGRPSFAYGGQLELRLMLP